MKNIKLIVLTIVAALSTSVWAVDCIVSNTTAVSETFADGTVLYSIDSDGRENGNSKFASTNIIADGAKTTGAALSDKRFVIKFPVAVSAIEIYGYNSSSGRTINAVKTSSTMQKSSYTDITGSSNKNVSSSAPNYAYKFTASWSTPIAANTYIWFEFNNSCNFYKISYTADGSGGGDQGGGDQGGGDQGGGDQGGGDQGGGDQGGGDQGGGDTPSGEENLLIKGTTQQVASGLAAGSVATNLSKKDAVKLDKSKYFGVTLKDGYTLQANDTFIIHITTGADLGKFMLYADKDGTELLYDEGITYTKADAETPVICPTEEKKILLPATVNGKKAIYLYRENGNTQWNPTFDYIAIKRDGLTPTPPTPAAVESVSLNKTTLTLEAGQTETLTATVKPDNAANRNVSWSSDNTAVATVDANGKVSALTAGSATITVTTEDQGKTATCAVTVTAPAAPIDVESISIKSATTISIGASETLSVTYTPAEANTGKAITWTSDKTDIATVDANGQVKGVAAGTAVITATSEKGKTATCTVTVQAVAVTGVTLNKTSLSIKEAETAVLTATVQPTNATNKKVTWSSDKTSVATVNANGVVTGVAQGSATITVTTEDGNKTATCAVTVTEASTVPQTNLSLHVPEIYEASEMAGGYGGTLAEVGGREYEVYYASYDGKDSLSVTVSPVRKTDGITYNPNKQKLACKANDGWFEMSTTESKSDFSMSATEEFKAGSTAVHKLKNGSGYEFHIQGFDQFSFYGKENSSAGRNFEMYLDDTLKTMTKSTTASIRRFDISTREHVIRVIGIGSSNEEFYGFSLRVAQEPRTKWLTGNDSTQAVTVSNAIKPVTYVTKYNNIAGAETKLEWIGTAVEGIELQEIEGELTDTLVLRGNANAPAGEYQYAVVAYYNGAETSRAKGTFSIKYDIKAITETDIDADQGDEMDEIKCRYYVYDESTDIIVKWTPEAGLPGITTTTNNGVLTIGGTPTAEGKVSYLITVTGGDTITGVINVQSADLGVNPVLYLYKNKQAYDKDYIYSYLKDECNYNLRERKTKDDLRGAAQYAKYKWVLISEDVDANNPEVFKILRGGSHLPVLNMKAFSYSHSVDSLEKDYGGAWGEADNGSLSENGRSITVWRDDHPIFKALGKKQGDQIQILDTVERRGLMPIKVTKQGSLCLATAWTRDREDYYGDGVQETFLHEIPAGLDGGNTKYICFPLAMNSSMHLTNDGKNLLKKTIDYLLNDEATVQAVNPEITSFYIEDVKGMITPGSPNTIFVEIDSLEHPGIDLKAVAPQITVASPYTHTVPEIGDTIDLSTAQYIPYNYVVTDYIKRVVYEVTVVWRKAQGIEEVYSVGEWVNVYDLYGRKVVTTNENIYTMSLPRGIYIIVTENGQTLKITR